MKYYQVKEDCTWVHPGGGLVGKAGDVVAMDVDSSHKFTRREARGLVRRGGSNIFEVPSADAPTPAPAFKKKAFKKKATTKAPKAEGGDYKTREVTAEE